MLKIDEIASIGLSIVIPVYKCEKSLTELALRIDDVMSLRGFSYEVILVDDGCPNDSWSTIEQLTKRNPHVVGIKLSKNFGQQQAIACGLINSRGDAVVVMDGDLQDAPEDIALLLTEFDKGFDVVFARRKQNEEVLYRRMLSRFYYFLLSRVSGVKLDGSLGTFGIYSKRVISAVLSLKERDLMFLIAVKLVGFSVSYVDVERKKRLHGASGYTFRKMLSLAVNNLIYNSNYVLKFVAKFGLIVSLVSFLFGVYFLSRYYLVGTSVEGWTTLIVFISLLMGILISLLGVVAMYLGKVFDEVKERPKYFVETVLTAEK